MGRSSQTLIDDAAADRGGRDRIGWMSFVIRVLPGFAWPVICSDILFACSPFRLFTEAVRHDKLGPACSPDLLLALFHRRCLSRVHVLPAISST